MKTNDVFDIKRFTLLFRQNLIHHYRIILTSVIAVSGGLFLLLMFNQMVNRFNPWRYQQFIGLFMALSAILGIIYMGMAFPGLRSKERSYSFLLIPSSTFEKYLFEIINRIILFIIVFPILYWIIFNLEGNLMRLLQPGFEFRSYGFLNHELPWFHEAPGNKVWMAIIVINAVLMMYLVPFTGAASFMKHPLLKTFLALAVLLFFNLLLLSMFKNILGLGENMGDNHQFLFISTKEQALRFAGTYTMLINVGLLVASYFKLKEKGA